MRSSLRQWSGWMAAACVSVSCFVSACSGSNAFSIPDDDAGGSDDGAPTKDVSPPPDIDAAVFDATADAHLHDAHADGHFDGGFDSGFDTGSDTGFDARETSTDASTVDARETGTGSSDAGPDVVDAGDASHGTCPPTSTYVFEYINAPPTATMCGADGGGTCAADECCYIDKCVPF